MKTRRNAGSPRSSEQVELGQFIVADPAICHGRLTFKGTRVFVADVLSDVERGLSWDFIVQRWGSGKIRKAAVAEAVRQWGMRQSICCVGRDELQIVVADEQKTA